MPKTRTRRHGTRKHKSRRHRTRGHRKHHGGDLTSFRQTALTVLKNHNLTAEQLLMKLLKSNVRTMVLDDIEYSVRGLSLNFELMAKAKSMDTPVSIYFYSDH